MQICPSKVNSIEKIEFLIDEVIKVKMLSKPGR